MSALSHNQTRFLVMILPSVAYCELQEHLGDVISKRCTRTPTTTSEILMITIHHRAWSPTNNLEVPVSPPICISSPTLGHHRIRLSSRRAFSILSLFRGDNDDDFRGTQATQRYWITANHTSINSLLDFDVWHACDCERPH